MSNILKMLRGGAAPSEPSDADFENVTLLLHGDGTNGAQNNTFLDSSTNNFTITRNGNTTQGTFTPFSKVDGRWGNYFDGSGDNLSIDNASALDLDADFTIEAWIYPTSTTGGSEKTIVSTYTNGYIFYIRISDGRLQLDKYGVSTPITGTTAITANVWTHVAVTRSGNSWYIFINGIQDATATASTTFSNTSPLRVGDSGSGSQTFYGYIDDLRVTRGFARYTANFTPPTASHRLK